MMRHSIERHPHRIHIVNVLVRRLNARMTSPKNPIPETTLLAVVVALPPALTVVQVMVLDDDLAVEELEEPVESRRRRQMDAKTTVAPDLRERNVLMAHPQLIKAHGQANAFQGKVGHHGDADHVEEFLPVVCIRGEEGVGVFGEVVGAMELPETAHVMHQAVIPVEPEVKGDAVETNLQREPFPVHLGRQLVVVVGEVGRHDDAGNGGLVQRSNNLVHSDIRYAIPRLVAIQEAISMAKAAEQMDQVDDGGVEHCGIEGYDGKSVQAVARVG